MFTGNCNLDTLDLSRQGALYANHTLVFSDGQEIYKWYDAQTDQLVATFIGTPYYSPSQLGEYYVIVTHPDNEACFQVLGPRIITSLDGCCELSDEN